MLAVTERMKDPGTVLDNTLGFLFLRRTCFKTCWLWICTFRPPDGPV